MKNPPGIQKPKTPNTPRRTRSVLKCGGPPQLSVRCGRPTRSPSAVKPAHSKTWRLISTVLFLLAATLPCRAQSYSIDWHTIDGGGGTSSGGTYTLSSTIGQPDTGTLTGGSYALQGGFWPGLVVPSTGAAPALFIQFSGVNVIISWSPSTPGFSLEESSTLLPLSWGTAPSGGTNPATIPLGSGPAFYRLKKP